MKNDYGVNELIEQLESNPYGQSKIEVLYELMKKNLDYEVSKCSWENGYRIFSMSDTDFSKETS